MIGWILTHGPARRVLGLILAAATILLFLMNLRRAGERAGRAAERLETSERNDAIHRRMLEAASRRPRNRDALAERLRGDRFCGLGTLPARGRLQRRGSGPRRRRG